MAFTTSILLDKRFRHKSGLYPVKLRLTHKRRQVYYPLDENLTEEEWDKTLAPKPRGRYKELRVFFNSVEQRAIQVGRSIGVFSFAEFERRFNNQGTNQTDLLCCYTEKIEEMRAEGRIGNSDSFKCALESFKKFIKSNRGRKFDLNEISPSWLNTYERWMIAKGCSLTTVGIYLRTLRTIFNDKINEGLIPQESYPFGKRKYQIPTGSNIKKALNISEIQQLISYKSDDERKLRARDLWVFSYLCNGANIKDIARFKYGDIDGNMLVFNRAKTIHTSRGNPKPIVVALVPETLQIIEKWGKKPIKSEEYIFDLACEEDTPEEFHKKIRQAVKTINKYMKRIASELGIHKPVTTYVARHSFATILKRSGVSTEFISESLGHQNLSTTESYLDSFEDGMRMNVQSKLLDFKKS